MNCPNCLSEGSMRKKGSYIRSSDGKTIPRFRCLKCLKSKSATWWSIDYRLRKRDINQTVFTLLCQGTSQRSAANQLEVRREAIARRIILFGRCARSNLEFYRNTRAPAEVVIIDEMESFEHSKCKPLTMPIIVENRTRKILALAVGSIAAKGTLTKKSLLLYGKRKCQRRALLLKSMQDLQKCFSSGGTIKSDQSQHYIKLIRDLFPKAKHTRYKGRKPKASGLGELKKGGFDPLFSLNHTAAMFRDNVKRLSRKTWCTTKKAERLEDLMYLYANFHNCRLEKKRGRILLKWLDIPWPN